MFYKHGFFLNSRWVPVKLELFDAEKIAFKAASKQLPGLQTILALSSITPTVVYA